jgi:hypothetical protein
MLKPIVILFGLLSAVVGMTWCSSHWGRLQVSVRFIGYTNASYGPHVGVVQVFNAGPFAVVRGRSPFVIFDSPTVPIEYAPTGWSLLQPGECEQVQTDPITNGLRWRLTVVGQRLGHDDWGITPESRARRVVTWLQDHRIPVPAPIPHPRPQFSSDWIEP